MLRFKSLRSKYTLICLAICCFSIFAVSSMSFYFSSTIASDLFNSVIREKTEKTTQNLNNWFTNYATGISQVIQDINTFDDYSPEQLHPFLKSKVKTYEGKISDFYFGYATGRKTLSGVGWTPPPEYDATKRPWYQKAAQSDGVVFTEPYVDAMTGEMIITVARALRHDGEIVGVLASDIFLKDVIQVVQTLNVSKNSYGLLLDDQGRVIVHPNASFMPTAEGIKTPEEINWPNYITFVKQIKEVPSTQVIPEIEFKDYSGKEYIYHFSEITACHWHFGIAVDKAEYMKPLKTLLLYFAIALVLSLLISLVVINNFVSRMVVPIKALNAVMQKFSSDKTFRAEISTEDEIGVLGQSFNDMADTIEVYSNDLKNNLETVENQRNSYARFVPEGLLALFNKRSILEVEPKDHKALDMTVMFSDIRSYTAISESLTPKEIFDLLNNYFHLTNPIIEKNYGIIDKYIGDAIMALFPRQPDDALRSAIEIKKMLLAFNQKQVENNHPKFLTGVGLHYGTVEIGAVGDQKRLQATVIGDAVNLASRLESATKLYAIEIIISDDVYTKLEKPSDFKLRMIDTVRVKGKDTPIVLYEVYDIDDPAIIEKKDQLMPTFSEAMACYKSGDFEKAIELFKVCHETCPEDTVSPVYVKRCTTLIRIPPGDDWAGISTL